MSFVYITEHGCSVGIEGGYLVIKHKDDTEDKIPKCTIEGISSFSRVQISSSCARFCMENGIHLKVMEAEFNTQLLNVGWTWNSIII